jgi:hypothetical protein
MQPQRSSKSIISSVFNALAVFAGLAAISQTAFGAVELGQASVQSVQGQRLKVVVPYGKLPGEQVSVNRFSVESLELPDGRKIDGRKFTLSAPLNRNFVVLHSNENVYATSVKLALNVSNQANSSTTYDLIVPGFKAAADSSPAVVKKSTVSKRKIVKKKRKIRART